MALSTSTLGELNQLVIADRGMEEDVPEIFNQFLQLIAEKDKVDFGNKWFWVIVLDNARESMEEKGLKIGRGRLDRLGYDEDVSDGSGGRSDELDELGGNKGGLGDDLD